MSSIKFLLLCSIYSDKNPLLAKQPATAEFCPLQTAPAHLHLSACTHIVLDLHFTGVRGSLGTTSTLHPPPVPAEPTPLSVPGESHYAAGPAMWDSTWTGPAYPTTARVPLRDPVPSLSDSERRLEDVRYNGTVPACSGVVMDYVLNIFL